MEVPEFSRLGMAARAHDIDGRWRKTSEPSRHRLRHPLSALPLSSHQAIPIVLFSCHLSFDCFFLDSLLRTLAHLSTVTCFAQPPATMSNPLDTDAGSELFGSYEAELKLVQADLAQKLDQIPELSGEPRKAAISQAERALEEADEIVRSEPLHRTQ